MLHGELVCYRESYYVTWIVTMLQGESKTIDTSQLTTICKRVRPLAVQQAMESRLLWHQVTQSLMDGDLNQATEHKRAVSLV